MEVFQADDGKWYIRGAENLGGFGSEAIAQNFLGFYTSGAQRPEAAAPDAAPLTGGTTSGSIGLTTPSPEQQDGLLGPRRARSAAARAAEQAQPQPENRPWWRPAPRPLPEGGVSDTVDFWADTGRFFSDVTTDPGSVPWLDLGSYWRDAPPPPTETTPAAPLPEIDFGLGEDPYTQFNATLERILAEATADTSGPDYPEYEAPEVNPAAGELLGYMQKRDARFQNMLDAYMGQMEKPANRWQELFEIISRVAATGDASQAGVVTAGVLDDRRAQTERMRDEVMRLQQLGLSSGDAVAQAAANASTAGWQATETGRQERNQRGTRAAELGFEASQRNRDLATRVGLTAAEGQLQRDLSQREQTTALLQALLPSQYGQQAAQVIGQASGLGEEASGFLGNYWRQSETQRGLEAYVREVMRSGDDRLLDQLAQTTEQLNPVVNRQFLRRSRNAPEVVIGMIRGGITPQNMEQYAWLRQYAQAQPPAQ